ncbi:pspA/IM30 family protein [Lyngbya aestuarii BL J]|uniref:PspA/IM30 family protein n=1 Tax=Lyngbya aestuarii BL J TaxID=1348334 RepID=U7QG21_9CYAN|nr:PspA/IM30 family protein [Lyngbya aestuarii]ERT06863.1 pspA/IM30 family protein [Lyngbya aestuarii BL J]
MVYNFILLERVLRWNLQDIAKIAENPDKLLDLMILNMQEDLIEFRQVVDQATASQKKNQQQYNQYKSQADKWFSRVQLALEKGKDNLAKEALQRYKQYQEQADEMKFTLDQETIQVNNFQNHLITFENQISELKIKQKSLRYHKNSESTEKMFEKTITM